MSEERSESEILAAIEAETRRGADASVKLYELVLRLLIWGAILGVVLVLGGAMWLASQQPPGLAP